MGEKKNEMLEEERTRIRMRKERGKKNRNEERKRQGRKEKYRERSEVTSYLIPHNMLSHVLNVLSELKGGKPNPYLIPHSTLTHTHLPF